jgi:hypothetical protein
LQNPLLPQKLHWRCPDDIRGQWLFLQQHWASGASSAKPTPSTESSLHVRIENTYSPPHWHVVAGGAENLEEAIDYALQARAVRDPFRVAFSTYWPLDARFRDRLRAYPRFCELLSEMGFE